MSSSPVLTVMINAVRKAARGVQRDYGEVSSLQVSMKGPGDFVTNSDKKAESVLRGELAKVNRRLSGETAAEQILASDPELIEVREAA